MKLELLQDLSAEDIGKIWIQKHMDQEDAISAVVPAETYKKMLSRSKEYPMVTLTNLPMNIYSLMLPFIDPFGLINVP
jgi:hypothetical protein